MTRTTSRCDPTVYRLQVDGHLDHHWSSWFDDLTLIHHVDGTTSLTGPILDQAQLHGLLTKIRDMGVTLIHVERIGRPSPSPDRIADVTTPAQPDTRTP